MGLRLPVERLKIEPTVLVEGNTLIFKQSALQRRTDAVARTDTPFGVDHPVPGQVLRAPLERITNPPRSDARISRKIDAGWRRNHGRDSAIGHHATFRYLPHNFEDRFPVRLPILGLMALEYQVPQSRM